MKDYTASGTVHPGYDLSGQTRLGLERQARPRPRLCVVLGMVLTTRLGRSAVDTDRHLPTLKLCASRLTPGTGRPLVLVGVCMFGSVNNAATTYD